MTSSHGFLKYGALGQEEGSNKDKILALFLCVIDYDDDITL